jgi:hypothetical protein
VRLEAAEDGRLIRHLDEPDRRWPDEDQASVRGAARFILGGFIGSNIPFGGLVRERALQLLQQHGLQQVKICQIPVGSADAGLRGALLSLQHIPKKVSETISATGL